MVKTFGVPRECGAPEQLPLLNPHPPPLSVALGITLRFKELQNHWSTADALL